MPDFFEQQSNFTNPDYATPEQLAQAREYAKFLIQGQPQAKSGSGVLANLLAGLVGGYDTRRSNDLQKSSMNLTNQDQTQLYNKWTQGPQQQQASPVADALINPQRAAPPATVAPNPAPMPGAIPPPTAPTGPEVPSTPKVWGDKEAEAAGLYEPSSPAQKVAQGFQERTMPPGGPTWAASGAGGAPPPSAAPAGSVAPPAGADAALMSRLMINPWTPQPTKEGIAGTITPKPMPDVYGAPGFGNAYGVKGVPVGTGYQPGIARPVAAGSVSGTQIITPQGPSVPGLSSSNGGKSGIDELAALDRSLSAEKTRTEGGAGGEADVIKSDLGRAATAPDTLKNLGLIRDTITKYGDNITFGKTSGISNDVKRVIDNYVPGLSNQSALAGSDVIEKLNAGLAANLSRQLGLNPSDIHISMGSVPGLEKSKQGTLSLIDMMEQATRNDQALLKIYADNRGDLSKYVQLRNAYLGDPEHAIKNPITGNPINIGAKSAAPAAPANTTTGGGFKILKVY